MSSSLLSDHALNESDGIYKIYPPSLTNWIAVLLVAIFLNLSTYLLTGNLLQAVIVVISITIFSVGSWYFFGYRITKLLISRYVTGFEQQPGFVIRILLQLFGLKAHTARSALYIEGYTKNLQFRGFNNILSVLKNRYFDVLSACFGVTLILLLALGLVTELTGEVIFTGFVVILILSPFLVFWLIPLLWTVEDSGIREVDLDTRQVWEVGYEIRKGFLSRFLGTAGIIAAFSYLISNLESIYEYIFETTPGGYSDQVISGIIVIGAIFFFIGGISILLITFYLQFYHPMIVNEFRKWLHEEYDVIVGVTSIRNASSDELSFYNDDNDFLDFNNIGQFFVYETEED